jgi:hypothetical protein
MFIIDSSPSQSNDSSSRNYPTSSRRKSVLSDVHPSNHQREPSSPSRLSPTWLLRKAFFSRRSSSPPQNNQEDFSAKENVVASSTKKASSQCSSPLRRFSKVSSTENDTTNAPQEEQQRLSILLPPTDRSFHGSMNLLRHIQDCFGKVIHLKQEKPLAESTQKTIESLWKRGLVQTTLEAMHEFPRTTAIQDMGLIALNQAMHSLYTTNGRMGHLMTIADGRTLVNQLLDTMTIHRDQESIQEGCLLCLATLLTTCSNNPEADLDSLAELTSSMLMQSESSLRLLVLSMKRFRHQVTIQIAGIHVFYILSRKKEHRPMLRAAKATGPLFAAYFLGVSQKSLASRFAERVLQDLIEEDDETKDDA